MKRIILILLAFIAIANILQAQSTHTMDEKLQNTLTQLVEDFEGDVGIYSYNFMTNTEVAISADQVYPTASMIKVPIMLALFDKIEKGEYHYDQEVLYKDSLFYSSEDILGGFKDSTKIAISKLVMLMITMSDNTASLWCQQMAGTGVAINEWLQAAGMKHTRMNSRTPGRKKDWEKYGWGQTTPREMAQLVRMIYEGKAVSEAASEEMLRVMGSIYWRGEALSQIPPNVATASKQGAVSQSRSEVVLVNAPSGPYLFCVITKNQKDTSWEHDNAGYQLLRDVSKVIWSHYEPDTPFKPSTNETKWYK